MNIAEKVKKGAEYLDIYCHGWFNRIDLNTFDLASSPIRIF